MSGCQIEWRLARLMKEKGIRNKELAQRADLHYVTISKLKKLPERIDVSTLQKLCDALGCEPGHLIALSENSNE